MGYITIDVPEDNGDELGCSENEDQKRRPKI